MTRFRTCAIAAFAVLAASAPAFGHGIVGDRFFPATIATDDPFAADELALPTVGFGNHEEDYDFEWSKTLFKGFSVSLEGGYSDSHPSSGPNASGFDNFEITPTWQFLTLPRSEFVAAAAVDVELGGSGTKSVSDSFMTYTPKFLFGKGFGDLPDSLALLRPFAITGTVGYAIPGTHTESKRIEWGGALEYSLLYLRNNVRESGIGSFAAHFTPLVEFSLQTPTESGGTTGTVNPGLLWSGQYIQLGIEASIPINRASGHAIGGLAQLHFYLDDIFPLTLGRPLLGRFP